MKEIPAVGSRVVADAFSGEGIVEKVHALGFTARVHWPDGEVAVIPLEDLRAVPTTEADRAARQRDGIARTPPRMRTARPGRMRATHEGV